LSPAGPDESGAFSIPSVGQPVVNWLYIQPSAADAFVDEGAPGINSGAVPTMDVRPGSGQRRRSLVRFDLSSIPSGATILSAKMNLYATVPPTASTPLYVHRVTGPWAEAGITWDTMPTITPNNDAWVSVGPSVGWKPWTVTAVVQGWWAGTYPNYGLLVKYPAGAEGSAGDDIVFATREDATTANRPTLEVQYSAPSTNECSYVGGGTCGGCSAPSGLTNNTAGDVYECSDTGVRVGWRKDPGDWGDGGSGSRAYAVLRDGIPIQNGIPYGTVSYTDTTGVNWTNYTYSVRYINGCWMHAATAGVSSADEVDDPPSAPAISGATDVDPCTLNGVAVTFEGGNPASYHELYVDGSLVQSYIGSPHVYHPGDSLTHSYVVRAIRFSCFTDSNPVYAADVNNSPAITVTGLHTNACPATTVSLSTQTGMSCYQWYLGGLPIDGANGDTYVAAASGSYQVGYTNGSGCTGLSAAHAVSIVACGSGPPPVNNAGANAAKFTKGTGNVIDVTYDATTCSGETAIILYGTIGTWAGYAGRAQCNGGNTGATTIDGTGKNNVWFNIVWVNGTTAGHPGFAFDGTAEVPRTWTVSGFCSVTANDASHGTCP
jgi:hypothetical protein